ncbi:hypothetical protein D5266_09260, partial [bacterium c-19]|nr:hypothetical protein [bacterium c-19]
EDPEKPDEPNGNDPNDKDNPDNPDDPNGSDHDTSVKGMYNPATSMGGANTGDSTQFVFYCSILFTCLGTLSYLIYRMKEKS